MNYMSSLIQRKQSNLNCMAPAQNDSGVYLFTVQGGVSSITEVNSQTLQKKNLSFERLFIPCILAILANGAPVGTMSEH